jgi:hypothetical protein
MTPVRPLATERQLRFLKDLLETKDISSEARDSGLAKLATINKAEASILIGNLIDAPKKPVIPMLPLNDLPTAVTALEVQQALACIPMSFYAIDNKEINISMAHLRLTGDLTFLQVRKYMGQTYMRRLTGAVGGFTRHKLSNQDVVTLTKVIAHNPEKYSLLFAEHYHVCGICGAELTDPISRSINFGPTCRKVYGYDNFGRRVS